MTPPRILISTLCLLALSGGLRPAPPAAAMDLAAQAAAATGLTLARALPVADVPQGHPEVMPDGSGHGGAVGGQGPDHSGHGGAVGGDAPPLPFFVNFDTGANVKALAMHGRDLWLGMPNGLIRYNTASYDDHDVFTVASTLTTEGGHPVSGLPVNGIYALDVAPDGALWISTYGGGLTRFDGTTWKTYTPLDGLGDRWVYDVEFAPDGTMWVATWKGVSHFQDGRFTTYTEADGLADKWVYDVAVDPDGTVWAGTEGGVSVFDGKHFKSYRHADGLGADIPKSEQKPLAEQESRHHRTQGKANQGYNPNYVLAIATTPDGAKWFGTWGAGLSRFDGKSWKTYTARDGLGGNFVHALAVAPDGTLWAGTDGGASYLKDGRWITVSKRHGLIDDNVFSILFDGEGNTWLGTWTGLSKMTVPPPLPVHRRPPSDPSAPHPS
jgi:ligand-binding sensor domain-containing protein